MKPLKPAKPHPDIGAVRLVWLALFVSVFSFLFYQCHGDVLLYGDAVAHINIARRVFDSRTPGLLQLGTVWLPLPHLLIIPFIVSMRLWQAGTGGSIPSMAGYVLGVFGIFRLMRSILIRKDDKDNADVLGTSALMPWAAAILYAANPNLIYMQSTAMGESLYLAFFVWTVVYFAEFVRSPGITSPLIKCGLCLAAASLTRYDGWFLAAVLVVGAIFVYFYRRKTREDAASRPAAAPPIALVKFVLIASAAPALWLAYNALVYRNPLEFANGPYSAKAIEQKTATVNPAKGNLAAAASYFLKAAELNVGEAIWQGRLWLVLALAGATVAVFSRRGRIALLLWVPLPFYTLSVAYGSIPIFVPTWWPFSNYNVRYGLELLPAFAIFVPLAISGVVRSAISLSRANPAWREREGVLAFLTVIALAILTCSAIWRADPICYREAFINNRGRMALDDQLAKWFASFPADSTLLMYLGEHSGALEEAGIPLRRVINEGNHRMWKQPSDSQGLWERALANPAAYADFAIGFEGDPVWNAAKAQHLTALVEIHASAQAPAAIFPARVQAHTR
jgi:hypothetical protein